MAKPSEFDNQENPIKGSREVTSQQDSSIDYTTKNPSENYSPPEPTVNYGLGATGSVSTAGKPTGGGAAPFLHPFKLERVTDPDDTNSTKVRVYEGDVYAKIDTFQLDLLSITTRDQSYSTADPPTGPNTSGESTGDHTITFSDVTATMPQHQHDIDGGAVYIPQHKHLARDSTEDGLVMPNHKHAAETTGSSAMEAQAGNTSANTGLAGSHSHGAGSYEMPDHSHDQGGTAAANPTPTTGTTIQTSNTTHSHGAGSYEMPDHQHDQGGTALAKTGTDITTGTTIQTSDTTHSHGAGSYEMPDHQHDQGGTALAKTGTDISTGNTAVAGAHSHGAGSYVMPDHQHNQGGTALAKTGNNITKGTTIQTTDTAHTHGSGGYNIPDHSHKASDSSNSLTIPQHTHLPRNSSEDGLVIPDHEHEAGTGNDNLKIPNHTHDISISVQTDTVTSSSSNTCADTGHYHYLNIYNESTGSVLESLADKSVLGETDGVKDHSTDSSKRRVTGNTGDVVTTSSSALIVEGDTGGLSTSTSIAILGTSGSESSHSHEYNKDDHSHDLDGQTGDVYNYSTTSQKAITGVSDPQTGHLHSYNKDDHSHTLDGETGQVYDKASNDQITGTSADESTHSHEYNKDDHSHTLDGETGQVYDKASNDQITGTSADEATHSHDYNKDDHSHNLTGQTGSVDSSDSKAITGTSSTESDHQHTYIKDNHVHSVTGDTTEVIDYSATDGAERKVTGETGSIKDYSTESNKKCTGTTGNVKVGSSTDLPDFTISISGSSTSSGFNHSHKVPALTNTNVQTYNFVAVAGQERPDPLTPPSTTWTNVFNKYVILDDGSNSLFRYHETNHSDGDFYVKWVITIDGDAKVQSVVGSIHREAAGAGRPDDDPFGALEQSNTGVLTRGKNTGTFYQKIGTVSGDVVQQKQFSNINWSMTVLPEVS